MTSSLIKMSQPKKILVIRLKQIGDALLSLPVCNSLRKTYPHAQIDYLVYQHIADVLQDQPGIDNLILITPEERNNKLLYMKKIWWLRKQNYDIVIDLINVPISAILSRLTGAKNIIGFDKKKWRKALYKTTIVHPDTGDTVSKKLTILDGLPNPAIIDKSMSIPVTKENSEPVIKKLRSAGVNMDQLLMFIAPASRKGNKFWPEHHMIKTLNHLTHEYKAQLVLNWVPGVEGDYVTALYDKLDNQSLIFPNIDFSLSELPIAIAHCNFFFGNDGGPSHMAVATGVPSLAVYSPINNKSDWLPKGKPQHAGVGLTDALSITDSQWRAMQDSINANIGNYYDAISAEIVIDRLDNMLPTYIKQAI